MWVNRSLRELAVTTHQRPRRALPRVKCSPQTAKSHADRTPTPMTDPRPVTEQLRGGPQRTRHPCLQADHKVNAPSARPNRWNGQPRPHPGEPITRGTGGHHPSVPRGPLPRVKCSPRNTGRGPTTTSTRHTRWNGPLVTGAKSGPAGDPFARRVLRGRSRLTRVVREESAPGAVPECAVSEIRQTDQAHPLSTSRARKHMTERSSSQTSQSKSEESTEMVSKTGSGSSMPRFFSTRSEWPPQPCSISTTWASKGEYSLVHAPNRRPSPPWRRTK